MYWVLVGVTMSGDQYTECYCVCGQSVVHRVLVSVSGCGGGGGGVVVADSGLAVWLAPLSSSGRFTARHNGDEAQAPV